MKITTMTKDKTNGQTFYLMKKAKKIITQGERFASQDDQPNINDMNDDGIQHATH